MKRLITSLCAGLIAATVASAPVAAQKMSKVKVVTPRNSIFILSYFGGRDAGVFRKHGIDIEIDARPFKGFMAALPAKECLVTTYAGTAAIGRINQGLDWVIIGGGLTVMQHVFVRADSPYKTMADLRGKKFGSWSTGAGAFKAMRAAVMDGFGMDVMSDTNFVQAAAPALVKFLERGDVDAMFNISSLTVAAAAEPDKFRSVFSPNAYWKEKTGYPVVWSAPIVAWRSWVEEDRDRAKRFVAATHESFTRLRDPKNFNAAVKKYGKLAAVRNEKEAAVYRKWLADKQIFLARWDREVVDAQWKFLEVGQKHGIFKKVPSKEKHALILE